MLEKQLEELGLRKNEIKVYLSLFDLGQCRAGQIIDYTNLHRNLVYTALEELVEKNLVIKMEKGKVAMFEINDPVVLQELVENKLEIAKDAALDLQSRLQSKPRDVRVYEGNEGVVVTREKVIREIQPGEKYYVMGVSYSTSNSELKKFFPKLNKKIIDKGGDIRVLVAGNESADIVSDRGLTLQKNARYLPFGVDSPMWMTLFRDVMNISIVGHEPITFSIKSQETADGFRKYFEYFWEQKTKTEVGVEALRRAIFEMLEELKTGEEYFVLGASVGAGDERVQKLYDEFHTARIKKGVIVNMLAFKEGFKKIMDRFSYCGDPDRRVSHARAFMSAPPIPMQINIFKNKTFFIIYGDEPTVINFNHSEITEVFKNYFNSLWNQRVVNLFGSEGVKELCEKVLEEKEDLFLIGATGTIMENHYEYYLNDFTKRRVKMGLKIKMLANQSRRGKPFTRLPECVVKYLPDNFESPMVIWVFGDYVANVLWHNPETIFLINDHAVAEYYRKYYNALEKMSE